MREYRLKAVMEFLARQRRYVTINEVAEGIGMSWNTAEKDLNYLKHEGYVKSFGSGSRRYFRIRRPTEI
ncbi:DeoR family transcriptional regulator [Candidatus Woesearchaeota archaeon]|nr:DeoR family transcriptional regulator [Candidatus Woesearchaeota archaeon]